MKQPRPTHWWWIRHAPCDGPPGLIHGRDAQIIRDDKVIARVKQGLPDQALWLTSTMKRSIDSARALTHVPAIRVAEFDEQNFGAWEGQAHNDLWSKEDPAYRAFWDAPATTAPPGGESFADLVTRVSAAITQANEMHQGMDLVAVTHAGTIRAALALALGLTPDKALGFAVDHWSLTRLDCIQGSWRIGGVNGKS